MNEGKFGSDRKRSPHVGGVSAARSKMGRRRGVCERIAAPSGNGNRMPEPEGKHLKTTTFTFLFLNLGSDVVTFPT